MSATLPEGIYVTLCGSSRYRDVFDVVNRSLTLRGNAVYSLGIFGHSESDPSITAEDKELLDHVHFMKIYNSDAIFVINCDNYIGFSTSREINYAKEIGKVIYYLTDFTEFLSLRSPGLAA
ncbi:MAG: hypothetical protein JJU18_03925 [Oceanicaulis sp.]|nr:hypothetical protein [Oceanicaulis sp.]